MPLVITEVEIFFNFGKTQVMTVSDLKLKIFRQIDALEKNRLEESYGVLLNYINGQKNFGEWDKLTEEQKQGLIDSIEEIDAGKGIPPISMRRG
jgi:predicted xylose isomerase-like sugar epimerase